MNLGQGSVQQHGTGGSNDYDTSDDDDYTDDDGKYGDAPDDHDDDDDYDTSYDDDDYTDDDGKYSDAPDDDDDCDDNGQGGLVKKGSTLAAAAEHEVASSAEITRNLLDLQGVNVPSSIAPDSSKSRGEPALVRAEEEFVDSVHEEQVETSAIVKKTVVVKKPPVVVERKAIVDERSVDQEKAIEPPCAKAQTVTKVRLEEISKVIPSKTHIETKDETSAIKKAEVETTSLKKLLTKATVPKSVDPTRTSNTKAKSEANVKTSDPKQANTIESKSPRRVSSKKSSPVDVVEVRKDTVAKKPSLSKTCPIPVAVEPKEVEAAYDSKAKRVLVKKAVTAATATTKKIERKTAATKKAKSEDVEEVKDPKAKKVLAKKSNTSELKSVKKVQVERVKTVEVVQDKKKTTEVVKDKKEATEVVKDKKKKTTSAALAVVSSTPGTRLKRDQPSPPSLAQILQQHPQEAQKRPQEDESDHLEHSNKRRRQDKFFASGFKGYGHV